MSALHAGPIYLPAHLREPPAHHAQEGPDPLCPVLPVCDFHILPPRMDHWPRVNHWLHTVNHWPRVDHWPREFADRCLENTQAFELSSDVESSTPSFVEEATEATVDCSSIHTEFLSEDYCRCHCCLSWLEHQTSPAPPQEATRSQCLFKMKQILH